MTSAIDNNKINCIIIDDEPLSPVLIADYISKTPFLSLAGTFNNPVQALAAVGNTPVDLVFLDIQMPEINGLQFVHLLKGRSKVIFTTAYLNYAIQGFELDVIDYLVKPIPFDRFLKAANKALALIRPGKDPQPAADPQEESIFVKAEGRIVNVQLSNIFYIEGLKEYIAIHTKAGRVITLQSMKKMEEVLPPGQFLRVHKSFIVARNKIDYVERNHIHISGNIIPIGDTYRNDLLAVLNTKNLL